MEDTFIVLMQKNLETGFFEKELNTLKISENDNLITNAFVFEKDEKLFTNMKVTTKDEIENWEYDAIYDYYDEDVFKDVVLEIKEVDDCYNPTWEIIFPYFSSEDEMENIISKILEIHKNELDEVYKVIIEHKEDYI